jgi:phosphate transport system permease protein
VLRSALPGIGTGIVLSIARCIEETAVVMLTAGSGIDLPRSVFDSCRTLSLHFFVLAREGISMGNAYGTATVLILSVLGVNILAYWLMHHFISRGRR